MSGPLRNDALKAVAEIRIEDLDALDELDRILDNISTTMQKRHSTVHNLWGYSEAEKTVYTAHITARGSVKGEIVTMNSDDIQKLTH